MHQDCPDTASLQNRILNGSKVREEHVWSFMKGVLPELCSPDNSAGRRFRVLLQANAIFDALLLAISAQSPPVSLETLRRTDRGWFCSTSVMLGGSRRKSTALHEDLESALFLALLTLSKRLRNPSTSQKRKDH